MVAVVDVVAAKEAAAAADREADVVWAAAVAAEQAASVSVRTAVKLSRTSAAFPATRSHAQNAGR